MADLPIAKRPRDLGHPSPILTLRRHELAIEEQEIVIASKELRLLEIAEEEARITKDLSGSLRPEAERLGGVAEAVERKQGASTPDAYRARIKARQQHLLIHQRELRLLELDDERNGIGIDIDASREAIAKLEAEASHQRTRLNEESPNG